MPATLGWLLDARLERPRGGPDGAASPHASLLVERNRDVEHRRIKIVDEGGSPGQHIHPIEAAHPADDQRGEAAVVLGHAVLSDRCRGRTPRASRDHAQLAGRHECAGVRGDWIATWFNDVSRSNSVVPVVGSVVIRIGRPRETGGGRARRIVQRDIHQGHSPGVHVMAEVLPGVADDAQPVRRRVEVHAEDGAVQGQVSRDTRLATAVAGSSV